jgi:3-dehydroquinate synthase
MVACMKNAIFLYGPPGVGKSTLGSRLAKHFDVPFLDLDEEITEAAGKSITEIFDLDGEEAFRALETKILRSKTKSKLSVFALGGGSLLTEENRNLVSQMGSVISMMSSLESLQKRIGNINTGRPLLDEDPEKNLIKLLSDRKSHYQSFEEIIMVDDKSIDDLIWEVQVRLKRFFISGMGTNYEVRVQETGLNSLAFIFDHLNLKPPYFVITDRNINSHYPLLFGELQTVFGRNIQSFIFPAGEESKNMSTIQEIWHAMISANIDRGGTIIALGGGVTGDISGFAAATYLRGINWINLPTSLLAMVDASLGGKTGVNLIEGKNLVGAFYPPKFVLADTNFLGTLPDQEFLNGLAEMIKHGIIADQDLFNTLKKGKDYICKNYAQIISQTVGIKARIIVEDPYEKGIRECLNFGHTIGHALEKLTNYHLGHGMAVSIGMVVETWLAEQIGFANKGITKQIESTLAGVGLPVRIPQNIRPEQIILAMQNDKKKRQDQLYFALPEKIGLVRNHIQIPDLENLLAHKMEER